MSQPVAQLPGYRVSTHHSLSATGEILYFQAHVGPIVQNSTLVQVSYRSGGPAEVQNYYMSRRLVSPFIAHFKDQYQEFQGVIHIWVSGPNGRQPVHILRGNAWAENVT